LETSISVKIEAYGEKHEKVLNDYFKLYYALIELDSFSDQISRVKSLNGALLCFCKECSGQSFLLRCVILFTSKYIKYKKQSSNKKIINI